MQNESTSQLPYRGPLKLFLMVAESFMLEQGLQNV